MLDYLRLLCGKAAAILRKKQPDLSNGVLPVYLLVGLGNPGHKYVLSRHNVGFWVIDELAERNKVSLKEIKFQAYFTPAVIAGVNVVLVKPLTYMNRSGIAVGSLLRHFSLRPEKVLVIYDDMDLPLGKIRLRPGGGSGGHRGMASVITALGSEGVPRLRLGIGRQHNEGGKENNPAYVLSSFTPGEEEIMGEAVTTAADAVELFVAEGMQAAMNRYN